VSAALIDGKAIAKSLRAAIADAVAGLPAAPHLAVVLVGQNPASEVYVRNKVRETQAAGMRSLHVRLDAGVSQAQLEETIAALSADEDIDGILLQLPLPKGLDADAALARLDPAKDVDGLTQTSAGRLALGLPGLRPCTPLGCVLLAQSLGTPLRGLHVVVIGRSILVGKPAALMFLAQDCTVTIAHSRTTELAALCRTADILIPAVGRPEMVRGDWIKPGAVVLDVGINRVTGPDGAARLVGDVAFDQAQAVAGAITPVPGGVGPMTIACLLRNTVEAACARRGWPAPLAPVS
jgi:methylenetetrahydrofolate dehydrogenase (NADP+) / methenyltetrahydrofolate cyclohydrolase